MGIGSGTTGDTSFTTAYTTTRIQRTEVDTFLMREPHISFLFGVRNCTTDRATKGGTTSFSAPMLSASSKEGLSRFEKPLPRMHKLFSSISFEANIFNRTIARLLKKGKGRGTTGVGGDCEKGKNALC